MERLPSQPHQPEQLESNYYKPEEVIDIAAKLIQPNGSVVYVDENGKRHKIEGYPPQNVNFYDDKRYENRLLMLGFTISSSLERHQTITTLANLASQLQP